MERKFAVLFPLILVSVSVLSQAPPHDMGVTEKISMCPSCCEVESTEPDSR